MSSGCLTITQTSLRCHLCSIKKSFKLQIMKTHKLILLITFTVIIARFSTAQNSSETLDTVYLSKDDVSQNLNDFEMFNRQIANDDQTSFREILKGVDKDNHLRLNEGTQEFALSERNYVKVLRRSVNKSDNFNEFIEHLESRLPELKENFNSDNSLKDLYFSTKDQTLSGKLASLPSVL